MNRVLASLSALCLLATVGCGGEDLADPGMTPPVTNKPNPQALCLRAEPQTIQPGQEVTRCITQRLPTTAPLRVVQIDTQQNLTHHVIFYREKPDVTEQATHDCQALDILGSGFQIIREPLFVGETPTASLKMPPGVSYDFTAGAPYTLEVHYFNPGAKPITATAEVCLTPAESSQKLIPANMLFYVSASALNKSYDGKQKGLPPGQRTTIAPAGYRAPRDGAKIFGLTSHQHRTGVEFTISKSRGRDDEGQLLLRNTDWEHPELLRLPDDQPLTFDAKNLEGLRWTCTYQNTNDFYLTFGQSAYRNEMCILWGYYYPGAGFDVYFE